MVDGGGVDVLELELALLAVLDEFTRDDEWESFEVVQSFCFLLELLPVLLEVTFSTSYSSLAFATDVLKRLSDDCCCCCCG